MKAITDEEKQLYDQFNIRDITLTFGNGVTIGNDSIANEAMTFEEMICENSSLKFGSCNASSFSVEVKDTEHTFKNETLDVTMTTGDFTRNIGKFKVYSDNKTDDKTRRKIVAYDAIYEAKNKDVADWYLGLTFPMTLKAFRDSFFSYLGITQVDVTLVNDGMTVEKTLSPTTMSALTVMEAICEINACFGHINSDGEFEYINLFERMGKAKDDAFLPYPIEYKMGSLKYEEFQCKHITQVTIRQEDNDIGCTVGEDGNAYVIQGNFLCYGKVEAELTPIANNFMSEAYFYEYTPASVSTRGRPYMELGDFVKAVAQNGDTVVFPILRRSMSGIIALMDKYEAKGTESFDEKKYTLSEQVQQIKGKANVLVRTIEETQSQITDIENNLETKITQTADNIKTEASKTYATKDEFNDLSIGGRNLLLNTSSPAHSGKLNWGANDVIYLKGCNSKYNAGLATGNTMEPAEHGYRVYVGSGSYVTYWINGFSQTYNGGMGCLKKDHTYTISFDWKIKAYSKDTATNDRAIQLAVYGNHLSADTFNSIYRYNFAILTNDMKGKVVNGKCKYTFKIPNASTLTYVVLRIYFPIISVHDSDDYLEFSNIKLEEGNKDTDWTPAPEDVDNKFGNYSTTEQMNSAISQSAKDIKLEISDETDKKLQDYYTSEQTDTQINLSKDGIMQSVEQKIDALGSIYPSEDLYPSTDLFSANGFTTTAEVGAVVNMTAEMLQTRIYDDLHSNYYTKKETANEISARLTSYVDNDTYESYVSATAKEISAKLATNDLITEFNASAEKVELKSNRLIVESTNFKLSADGTVEAKNGKFSGTVTATEGNVGGWNIGSHGMYNDDLLTGFINAGRFRIYAGRYTYAEAIKASGTGDNYPNFGVTEDGLAVMKQLVVTESGASVEGGLYVNGGISVASGDTIKGSLRSTDGWTGNFWYSYGGNKTTVYVDSGIITQVVSEKA